MAKRVTVRLFAGLRERLGGETITVGVPDAAVVADLRGALSEQFPQSRELLSRCAVAIQQEYVGADQPVPDSGEIALIPPVSGG